MAAIFKDFEDKFGRCRRVARGEGPKVTFIHPRASIGCKLYLGAKGRISGIWFDSPRRKGDSVKAVVAELEKLPGTVALTVRPVGKKDLVAINATKPLAVGSTFKLTILAALQEQVRRGGASGAPTPPACCRTGPWGRL